jgi:hypothetical protein
MTERNKKGEGGGGLHFKAWAMAVIKQDSESDGAMLVSETRRMKSRK